MSRLSLLVFILCFFIACSNEQSKNSVQESEQQSPLNVLFIAIDDLRPELGCYGQSKIKSPNIDRLANEGFLFERAYCNVPVCGASRASLLSGLRPKPDRFLTYKTRLDIDAPEVTTLPQHFRMNGYNTVSLGKIFHHSNDAEESWSKPAWMPSIDMNKAGLSGIWALPENIALQERDGLRGPPYERADVHDSMYYDGRTAMRAKAELQALAKNEEPFFLAVGFLKPHLPFNAPEKYWKMYPDSVIEQPAFQEYPAGAPEATHYNWGELRNYDGVPEEGPVSDEMAHKLIQGYYASTSYADALVGQVIDELERLGLADNTLIMLWGDHGYSLHEHGLWCKHNTFHVAVKTPMILKVPGMKKAQRIESLVEYVDIYPSLAELAGLDIPAHTQGNSFVPLLENPSAKGKDEVYFRWVKSDAIKTDRYLYTEWFDEAGKSTDRMLYDHLEDPKETVNIADLPQHQELIESFHEKLLAIRALP